MHTDGVEFKATKLFKLSTQNRFLVIISIICYVAQICRSSCGDPSSAGHAEHA